MKEAVRGILGRRTAAVPPMVAATNITISSVAGIAVQDLIVLGISIAAVASHDFPVRHRTGRMMQATAQRLNVARLLGVQVEAR